MEIDNQCIDPMNNNKDCRVGQLTRWRCDDGDIYHSDEYDVGGRRSVPRLELHLHSVDLWMDYVDGCNLTLIILGKT